MFKIGITGSIGMGKTTIANMFSLLGVPVHDSDKEVSKILKEKRVLKKIANKWPDAIKKKNLDKRFLRNKIFNNKNNKNYLEGIIHPLIKKKKRSFNTIYKHKKILVYDVPLIYETNSQDQYDLIILAICPENIQKKRVLERQNIDERMFTKIKNNQFSVSVKLKHNPIVINTISPKFVTFIKVLFILLKIKLKS